MSDVDELSEVEVDGRVYRLTCDICTKPLDDADLLSSPCTCNISICGWCFTKHYNLSSSKTCTHCRQPINPELVKQSIPDHKRKKLLDKIKKAKQSKISKKKNNKMDYNTLKSKIFELCHLNTKNYLKISQNGKFVSRDSIVVFPVDELLEDNVHLLEQHFNQFGKVQQIILWTTNDNKALVIFENDYSASILTRANGTTIVVDNVAMKINCRLNFRFGCDKRMLQNVKKLKMNILSCGDRDCKKYHGPFYRFDYIKYDIFNNINSKEIFMKQYIQKFNKFNKNKYKNYVKKYCKNNRKLSHENNKTVNSKPQTQLREKLINNIKSKAQSNGYNVSSNNGKTGKQLLINKVKQKCKENHRSKRDMVNKLMKNSKDKNSSNSKSEKVAKLLAIRNKKKRKSSKNNNKMTYSNRSDPVKHRNSPPNLDINKHNNGTNSEIIVNNKSKSPILNNNEKDSKFAAFKKRKLKRDNSDKKSIIAKLLSPNAASEKVNHFNDKNIFNISDSDDEKIDEINGVNNDITPGFGPNNSGNNRNISQNIIDDIQKMVDEESEFDEKSILSTKSKVSNKSIVSVKSKDTSEKDAKFAAFRQRKLEQKKSENNKTKPKRNPFEKLDGCSVSSDEDSSESSDSDDDTLEIPPEKSVQELLLEYKDFEGINKEDLYTLLISLIYEKYILEKDEKIMESWDYCRICLKDEIIHSDKRGKKRWKILKNLKDENDIENKDVKLMKLLKTVYRTSIQNKNEEWDHKMEKINSKINNSQISEEKDNNENSNFDMPIFNKNTTKHTLISQARIMLSNFSIKIIFSKFFSTHISRVFINNNYKSIKLKDLNDTISTIEDFINEREVIKNKEDYQIKEYNELIVMREVYLKLKRDKECQSKFNNEHKIGEIDPVSINNKTNEIDKIKQEKLRQEKIKILLSRNKKKNKDRSKNKQRGDKYKRDRRDSIDRLEENRGSSPPLNNNHNKHKNVRYYRRSKDSSDSWNDNYSTASSDRNSNHNSRNNNRNNGKNNRH